MSTLEKIQLNDAQRTEKQLRSVYVLGSIAALVVVFASILDIVISILLGGDPSAIPSTAVGRFEQFQTSKLLGLYYLDLLNMTTAIIMVPVFFALYAAHRKVEKAYSALATIVAFIGTSVFITNNVALPMMSLSSKYALAETDSQMNVLAGAGEAMLARGAHGSPGVFLGFILPVIASLLISIVMLKGGVFTKLTSLFGIAGSALFVIYFVFVTFIPDSENLAMAIATPGGLLTIIWMTLFSIRLLKLSRIKGE